MATQGNASTSAVGTSFRLGKAGPLLVANGGTFEFRTPNSASLTPISAADATLGGHVATYGQVGSLLGSYLPRADWVADRSATITALSNKLDANGSANGLTITPTGGTAGSLPDVLAGMLSRIANASNAAASAVSNTALNGLADNLRISLANGSTTPLPSLLSSFAYRAELLSAVDDTITDLAGKLDANGTANLLSVTPTGGTSGLLPDILATLTALAANGSTNTSANAATTTALNSLAGRVDGKLDANGSANLLHVTPTGGVSALLPDILATLSVGNGSGGNAALISLVASKLSANGSANALTVTPTGGSPGLLPDVLASIAYTAATAGTIAANTATATALTNLGTLVATKLDANGSANSLMVTPTGGTTGTLPDVLANYALNTVLQTVNASLTASKLGVNGSANALTVTPTGGTLGALVDYLGNAATKTDLLAMMSAAVVDLSNKLDTNGSANALSVTPTGGASGALTDVLSNRVTYADYFSGVTSSSVTIAAAATVDIGSLPSTSIVLTGGSPISSFGSIPNRSRRLFFANAMTLVNNAVTLALPTSANIAVAAGDYAQAVSDNAGFWRIVSYQTASGVPLKSASPSSGALVAYSQNATSNAATVLSQVTIGDTLPTTANTSSVVSVTHTPISGSNRLRVRALLNGSASNAVSVVGALFQGADANASSVAMSTGGAGGLTQISVETILIPGSTAPITFTLGAACGGNAVLTVNGINGSRIFGGALTTKIEVFEHAA